MTTTPKALIESKFAEDVRTTQYTATNCKATIDKYTAVNVTGLNAVLTVNLVPSGGVPDTSNQLAPVTIAAGKSWAFPDSIGHLLENGDYISTLAGTINAISIRASGREFT